MKKNMVYFVLYIVLITELLIVITERDELQEVEHQIRDKMISTLAEMYRTPIILSVPDKTSDYNLASKEPKRVVFTPIGLNSEAEKKNVKFFIEMSEGSKLPRGWPAEGISSDNQTEDFRIETEDGNAVFVANFKNAGNFHFKVKCVVDRILPDYLPEKLLEELKKEIGEANLHQESEPVEFTVNAKRIGGLKKKEVKFSL